jgi:hypothetical protein
MNWIWIMVVWVAALAVVLGTLAVAKRARDNERDAQRWRAHEQRRRDVEALAREARREKGDVSLCTQPATCLVQVDANGTRRDVFAVDRGSEEDVALALLCRLREAGRARERPPAAPVDGPPSGTRRAPAHRAPYPEHLHARHRATVEDLEAEALLEPVVVAIGESHGAAGHAS